MMVATVATSCTARRRGDRLNGWFGGGADTKTPGELISQTIEAISQPENPPDATEGRTMSLHKSKGLGARGRPRASGDNEMLVVGGGSVRPTISIYH
jgi:hypothetical protein